MNKYTKQRLITLHEEFRGYKTLTKEEIFDSLWDLMEKCASRRLDRAILEIPLKCKDFPSEDPDEYFDKVYFFVWTELEKIGNFDCRLERHRGLIHVHWNVQFI